MNKAITNSIIRFFLLWVVQVFVLRQVIWGWDGIVYLQVFLYPLFILLLPLNTPRSLTVFLGFVLGLAIDWLYESPGLHAGALVFTAYMRAVVLGILTPREGYSIKDSPTKKSLGQTWFFQYAATLILIHLFVYFSLEAFTFVYFKSILLKVLFSWLASMFFLLASIYAINPEA
ncbi:hypothetical protein [Lewinella cohaerens]|uniref:hypothetical protein n=1 Tax=Lewinella cohaerens TaxID=70995 RepID=UPI00036ABDF6|nr:hypothetical protein [Lewinella cohaerens]